MLRKPLALAAVSVALAMPSSALAMHGRGEQPPRVPRNLEAHGAFAPAQILVATTASSSFHWLDAAIGASVTGGCVLLLVGGRLVIVHRRGRVRLHHVS